MEIPPSAPVAASKATLEEILSEPIAAVQQREKSEIHRLLANCGGRCILFGAGNVGRTALDALQGIGIEPLALSDNNPSLWGTTVEGTPLLSPQEATEKYGADAHFFITIRNQRHYYQGTVDQLADLGCASISSGLPILWRFPEKFPPFLLYDLPHRLYQEADRVQLASEVWADDASRAEYLVQVRLRALGDPSGLRAPRRESYVVDEVFDLELGDVLVDCGAYDGDTIRDWIERQPKLGAIEAVEADSHSFAKLTRYVADLEPAVRDKIHLHRCAIGAQRGRVRFADSGDVGSRISDTGPIEVEMFPIDALFASTPVSMIKMDIEGAEFDALLGAHHVIERDRPILAICVYHSQQDLWRLPLLIKATCPDYRLYLRSYQGDGFQAVAYGVPPERVLKLSR